MGMAATQARYLSLVAQQSNLEYQGQQINQERSILSQQVSELYNSLLALKVPTPPATTDFQTVQYIGSIGASSYTFDPKNVKPGANDTYILTLTQGVFDKPTISKDYNIAVVNQKSTGTVTGSPVTGTITQEQFSSLYVVGEGNTIRKAVDSDVEKDSETGVITLKDDVQYMLKSDTGSSSYTLAGAIPSKTVNGEPIYTIDTAQITEEQKINYKGAIERSGLQKPNGEPYTIDDFYIYFNSNGNASFVLKTDVDDGNNNATTYSYVVGGGATSENVQYENCRLTFDPSNGRITEIALPNYATTTDADGNQVYDYTKIESYSTMKVEAKTTTDELAYQDAMAKYEYDQYEYDRKQTEINAKTEKIQEMDRNLELKLTRLDTQRQQITTEIEALEKVLDDNIEQSYKTFSG